MNQKKRYWLLKRGHVFYIEDSVTREQKSLRTSDKKEAQRIRDSKNEATENPMLGLTLAKAYLAAYDPKLIERTWHSVMEEFLARSGKESTKVRRQRALRAKPFDLIRQKKITGTL